MSNELNLLNVVEDSFSTYVAMTIQDRALIDARDGLKPCHRLSMYSLLLHKYIHSKPFVKSQECLGAAMADFYVHGDGACYDLMARLAKSYSMRYPLMDFKGQYGHIITGKPSAPRYTDMRLGEIGGEMYKGIDENCIDIWFDNYSGTKQFPSVAPSLGFYNICNGTAGIATAMSSSIPQFNLREVNEAMIKLLWNPDIDFEEIYCPPDFATGGTILNADKVKEILKYGGGEDVKNMKFNGKKLGSSVRMRATATYDQNENAIFFTEVPYGVYTSTITDQIVKGINNGEILGIAHEGIKDLSKREANIKIILEKGINPTKMIKTLYKKTDLDSSYAINMIMLDHGTRPKRFTWKEALQAHLDHEIEMRTKIHENQIKKIDARVNIIDGLLLAIANIDEVVSIIRKSKDKITAKERLVERFKFNELQVSAIIKMPLGQLANMESIAYKSEKENLLKEKAEKHIAVLENKDLLYKEIEEDLRAIAKKYGDDRRTKLTNFDFDGEEEDAEPIEKKELIIHYTNKGNFYTQESSTLMTTRRGGKGSKIKLLDEEVIIQSLRDDNLGSLLVFTNTGRMHRMPIDDLPLNGKVNAASLFEFEAGERITSMASLYKKTASDYLVFVTKNGKVKRSETKLYVNVRGKKPISVIGLDNGDEVISVHCVKNEKLGILTSDGNFVIIKTEDISAQGRAAKGVAGIKLSNGKVITSHIIEGDYMLTVSSNGLIKKSKTSDFPVQNRGTKGMKISGVRKNDTIVDFLTSGENCDIIVISNKGLIKFDTSELTVYSRTATGVQAMKLQEGTKIIRIVKN